MEFNSAVIFIGINIEKNLNEMSSIKEPAQL